MTQPIRAAKGWAAVSPSGYLIAWTVQVTRREAIAKILLGHEWAELRKRGWRVVKVRITPVEEPES